MMFKRVSLIHGLVAAWNIYRKNICFFLVASLVLFALKLPMLVMGPQEWQILGGWGLLVLLLELVWEYQLLYYGIRMYEGETPLWRSFFILPSSNVILFVVAKLRYFIIAAIALLCLLLPGIWYLCSNYFAGYSIVYSLTDSIKKDALISGTITKHNRLRILLFLIITSIEAISVTGVAPYFVGGKPFFVEPLIAYFFAVLVSLVASLVTSFVVVVALDLYNQLMEPYEETVTVI